MKRSMRAVQQVEIVTPKKWTLYGLWLGPAKPQRVYIFVHGLAGSIFGGAEQRLTAPFVSKTEAVLLFNNRGHDIVSKLYGHAPKMRRGYKRMLAGAVHEVFAECVDDIEGAVRCAERTGAAEIVLVGHSTGCQKSVYWAAQNGRAHKRVRAVVLLAPVSDRAAYLKEVGPTALQRAERVARKLVESGKKHALLPMSVWPALVDAQRFLSLASATSKEEIFLYAQPNRVPATLQKVPQQIVVLWAGEEEYADRSNAEILSWFEEHICVPHLVHEVAGVSHSFYGGEREAAAVVRDFMKGATRRGV